ncbi:hypothetical protein [Ekhidna sp.]|jgi:hypothetical protein|uniref:hypothetical protein n=1 Tax=Ekhidna sp. TaxID=2608089 RepID=UPI0032EB2481
MRNTIFIPIVIFFLTLNTTSAQISEGDTVYFDFGKGENEVFEHIMMTRVIRASAGSSPGYIPPFFSYGIVDSKDSDRKGREWHNIQVFKAFKYYEPFPVRV